MFSETVTHPATHKPDAYTVPVTCYLKWPQGAPDYPYSSLFSFPEGDRGRWEGSTSGLDKGSPSSQRKKSAEAASS